MSMRATSMGTAAQARHRRSLAGRAGPLALAAATLALGASGCTVQDNSTQITVVMSSEAVIPKEINTLVVRVQTGDGSNAFYNTYDLTKQNNGYFPQTLALVPRDQGSVGQPVTVTIEGQYNLPSGMTSTTVLRTAVASYVEGRSLLLPMSLRMACLDTMCPTGQSCVGGVCTSPVVDTSKLAEYRDAYVFGDRSPSCFDDAKCLASSTLAPAGSVDLQACTFELPPGALSGTATSTPTAKVNATILWSTPGDRLIVLDGDDAAEGWTLVTDGDGGTAKGKLSPGICNALRPSASTFNKANGLYLDTTCAAKSRLQPSCDPSLNTGVCFNGTTCYGASANGG